jgi:UDP-N-acetyl-D-mannosaminuronate dehydrogenase
MVKSLVSIIGLGYVGLPLALEFSKKNFVVGFDINLDRINEFHSIHGWSKFESVEWPTDIEIAEELLKQIKNESNKCIQHIQNRRAINEQMI